MQLCPLLASTALTILALPLCAQSPVSAPVDPPAAVVRRALEAQARGDLAAVLAETDLTRATPDSLAWTTTVLEKVLGAAQWTDLAIQDRATLLGDQLGHALWRGTVSYTLTTAEGSTPVQAGLLAHLTQDRAAGVWRIANLYPDELLNLELEQRRKSGESPAAGSKPSETPSSAARLPSADALDYAQINTIIDGAAQDKYVNERRLALTLTMKGIGSVPLLGDGVAMTYEFMSMVVDGSEALVELQKRGLSTVAAHKVAQTAVGALQLAVEVVPWMDRSLDGLGLALDHYTYNLELQRAMLALKDRLMDLQGTEGIAYKPQFYALTPGTGMKNPPGVDVFVEDGSIVEAGGDALRPFGAPVRRMNVAQETAFGQMAGFQLLGEVAVPMADAAWQYMEKFSELGAVRVGDDYLLAIDVSQMLAELQIEGDSLLENPELLSGDSRYLLVAPVTCRRGKQTLRVRLLNGEWTDPVEIWATLMNRVGGFEIRNARQGISRLNVGQIVEGMKIYGLGPGMDDSDPQNQPPDLTPWPACLDLGVTNPDVVELARDKTFSVKGVSSGTANLQVLLIGSAAAPEYAEVPASFPIDVTDTVTVISGKVDMNFYAAFWKVNLEYELRALGPAGFTVIKQGQGPFPGTQTAILELRGPAAGSDVQSDQYELRAKVTDIRPLKGQTLDPAFQWIPYFNFTTNDYVKGPEAIYRFSVTRGKSFNAGLGLNIHTMYSSTGNAQPGDGDMVLDLLIR